ncbi:MAG: hypothetical protein WC120_01110 [Parcubacteria group bacterium]
MDRKIEAYSHKVIISGTEIEHYEYKDRIQIRGYKRKPRKKSIVDENEKVEKKENPQKTMYSVNRTRTRIRRMIYANPDLNKFLTLTTTMTDISKTNNLFNLFVSRMKNRFPEFRYIAVPEFQKDIDFFGKVKPDGGEVHYHLLCNLRYVKSKELADIWAIGFINIKKLAKNTNLGAYMSKYLNKDMLDNRMFRKRKYFYSQDLIKPLEIIGGNAQSFMQGNTAKLIKEKTFNNMYTGKVVHKTYKMEDHTACID